MLISPFFDTALPSGGVVYSVNVAREWLSRGRRIAVLCGQRERTLGPLQSYVDAGQLMLHPIVSDKQIRFSHHIHTDVADAAWAALQTLKPDVVHVHNFQGMLGAVQAAVDSEVPVILTALDFGLLCFNFCLLSRADHPAQADVEGVRGFCAGRSRASPDGRDRSCRERSRGSCGRGSSGSIRSNRWSTSGRLPLDPSVTGCDHRAVTDHSREASGVRRARRECFADTLRPGAGHDGASGQDGVGHSAAGIPWRQRARERWSRDHRGGAFAAGRFAARDPHVRRRSNARHNRAERTKGPAVSSVSGVHLRTVVVDGARPHRCPSWSPRCATRTHLWSYWNRWPTARRFSRPIRQGFGI